MDVWRLRPVRSAVLVGGAAVIAATSLAACTSEDATSGPIVTTRPEVRHPSPPSTGSSTTRIELPALTDIEPGPPGDLIWSRPFEVTSAKVAVEGHLVVFHSRDRFGKDIPVSGYVLVPTGVPEPPGGRGVVAWAHGTKGLADGCAPSSSVAASGGAEVVRPDTYERMDGILAAGHAVVASDYPGLGTPGVHPYLDGGGEGRSVLDSIRAARHLGATGPTVIQGFSQGTQAAFFAAQLAPTYAPEIDLRAVVAVGTPSRYGEAFAARHLAVVQSYLPKVLAGILAGRPDLDRSQILTPSGEAAYERYVAAADDPEDCNDPTFDFPTDLKADPMQVPEWRAAFDELIPGRSPIAVPVLMVQSEDDEQALALLADGVCTDLAAHGTDVTMWRYRGPRHVETMVESADDRMAWIDATLAGRPPPAPSRPEGNPPRVLTTCPSPPAG